MLVLEVIFEWLRRHQPRPRAFRREWPRRDGVQPDVIFRPFHGERGGQRQNARFRASRRHDKPRPAVGRRVGGYDIQHVAAELSGNPALAKHLRAVK